MTILVPPPLRPGDRIGIAAPAGPVRPDALAAGMAYLEKRGFTLIPGAHVRSREAYLAGSDRQRLEDLNRMLADDTLRGIWFARGGYGSGRIVADLDLDPLARHPKTLIGYSDLTVIQAAVFRRHRLASYYGPMVCDLGDPRRYAEESLWEALSGEGAPLRYPIDPRTVVRHGAGEGILTGGCLSLIASLVGTPWDVETDGTVLFWEEVNEEPFRIDRMLGQLRHAGKLARLRGMVIGSLVGCRARDGENEMRLEAILEAHLSGTDYPVVRDFPAGHAPAMLTLPLGRRVRLDTQAETPGLIAP